MLSSIKSNSIWKISLHYNLSPTCALLYCFRYHFWHMLFCAYFLVVLFSMLNTITLAAAAAQSPPQGSIHFYRISCCVWIFDSKPNTEQNQRVEAGVSITLNSAASPVIKTVDPSEPNLPRQLTPKLCHQCLALITSSADICLACKRQMWEG